MTITINGQSVEVTLRKSGAVQWCSDWAALVVAAVNGHPQLRVQDYGTGSLGHREVFVDA